MTDKLSKLDIKELELRLQKEMDNYHKAIRQDKSFEDARKIKWRIHLLEAELRGRKEG
jgi:hypothetical protein